MKDEKAPDKLPHFIILPSYFILSSPSITNVSLRSSRLLDLKSAVMAG